MHRNRLTALGASALAALAAASAANAGFIGLSWRTISPTEFELYVEVETTNDVVRTLDLGATPLPGEAPANSNNGLFFDGGPLAMTGAVGPNATDLAGAGLVNYTTPPSVSSPGGRDLLTASWFRLALNNSQDSTPQLVTTNDGEILGVRIGAFLTDGNTTVGGPDLSGAPSSLYVGGVNADGDELDFMFEIPAIPAPGALPVLAGALALTARRRR